MRLRMKRPPLPSDHLTSNLDENVDLEVQPDGTFKGQDGELLSHDTVFLREAVAALADELDKKH